MTDKPADWAIQKACDLLNEAIDKPNWWVVSDAKRNPMFITFARYIESHEEAPVDPDLLIAREACAVGWGMDRQQKIMAGEWDGNAPVQDCLRAIKLFRERNGL